MSSSIYTFSVIDGVICIEDCDGPKSVTNDIENVLDDLRRCGMALDGPVIYRDSEGLWSEIRLQNGKFQAFHGPEYDTREEAIAAIARMFEG